MSIFILFSFLFIFYLFFIFLFCNKIEILFQENFFGLKAIPISRMSKVLEYYTVYTKWQFYQEFKPVNTDQKSDSNFEKNMEEFESAVNELLEEGWQPLGAPTFSITWLSRTHHGIAIQALVREKNVEQAVVVEVNPKVLVAEQVRGLRCSLRVAVSGDR
jgi:hypothetical protein